MGKSEDILIDKKLDYGEKKANQYNLSKFEYYKADAFNYPDNLLAVFYVQDNARDKCQYCRNRVFSNNKLHCHYWENCNKLFDNSISENKYNTAHAFNIILYLPETLESMERNNHIWQEIQSVKGLKANLLVGTDITNKLVKKKARLPALFCKKHLKNLLYNWAAI